jgi:hypothetical protein
MADGEERKYQLKDLDNLEAKPTPISRGFNGRGQALFVNDEIYEGDFVEGVRHN